VAAGQYGTGVLLFDGTAVLTAAHLFANNVSSANIIFETRSGIQTISSSRVLVNPNYDTANSNSDLALVWLSQDAPIAAERFGIYRGSNEIGQTFTLVGYGTPGSGSTGTLSNFNEAPVRVKASNQFDADSASLGRFFGDSGVWEATSGKQLVADFDNGLAQNDALGSLINKPGLGLGTAEGLISKGDSGGPAFIGNLVAGIASYTARLSTSGAVPDVDNTNNSSFGEIAGWQRVSAFQQWIDQSLRSQYINQPATQVGAKGGERRHWRHYAGVLLGSVQWLPQRPQPNCECGLQNPQWHGTGGPRLLSHPRHSQNLSQRRPRFGNGRNHCRHLART
jgi:hypothetical protein